MRSQVETATAVRQLRAQLERVQGKRMDAATIPTHPALAALLPGGGLRAGSAYSLAPSGALLLSLLARPSQAGSWCAVIGMPELGAEAAEQLGVDLERLVFIPEPGERWLAVVATVAEVLPVVAVRPQGRVRESDAAKLAARLRERGSVLLTQGFWPQAEASLSVSDPEWTGLGAGHGLLQQRALTVTVQGKRATSPRRARVLLPDGVGELRRADVHEYAVPMRAVG